MSVLTGFNCLNRCYVLKMCNTNLYKCISKLVNWLSINVTANWLTLCPPYKLLVGLKDPPPVKHTNFRRQLDLCSITTKTHIVLIYFNAGGSKRSCFYSVRCKSLAVSYWDPYWRQPADVCGVNCLLGSSLIRYDWFCASLNKDNNVLWRSTSYFHPFPIGPQFSTTTAAFSDPCDYSWILSVLIMQCFKSIDWHHHQTFQFF